MPELPQQVETLLQDRSDAQVLVEQALSLSDQPGEQKVLYRRAIELDPMLGAAHNNLGVAYLEEGEFGDAIRAFREAAARMPATPIPRFNLGYSYELIGRLRDAEEHYEAALRLAPEDPDYMECLARVYLRRRDHLLTAEDLLKRALEVETRPEHVRWAQGQLDMLRKGFIP